MNHTVALSAGANNKALDALRLALVFVSDDGANHHDRALVKRELLAAVDAVQAELNTANTTQTEYRTAGVPPGWVWSHPELRFVPPAAAGAQS